MLLHTSEGMLGIMQGSTSDLQFLIGLNLSIIFIGAGLRHFLIYRSLPSGATPTLGQDIYRVIFGLRTSCMLVCGTYSDQDCKASYLPCRSFCCSHLQMACQARRILRWRGDFLWQYQVP